jgi:hypothetical protein
MEIGRRAGIVYVLLMASNPNFYSFGVYYDGKEALFAGLRWCLVMRGGSVRLVQAHWI